MGNGLEQSALGRVRECGVERSSSGVYSSASCMVLIYDVLVMSGFAQEQNAKF